ncbi:MAG TPA: hypothetical protein DEP84_29105, partial [Chloroflexi bacterium]|nr:hypothetical protein [Chloroflexota bacterium]
MLFDLAVLGDLVADILLPVEELPLRPNAHGWAEGLFVELGGGCNFLVAARRMNLTTTALGAVGGDSYGQAVKEMLVAEGVDISSVVTYPDRQTVLCVVVTDRVGQHVFLGIKDDGPQWPYPPAWIEMIRRSRSLLTDGYTFRELLHPDDVLAAMSAARQAGVPVFFDPGPSIRLLPEPVLVAALAATDVLLLTLDEAHHLVAENDPGAAAQALRAFGPNVVVTKAGAEGCFVAAGQRVVQHPGFRINVVDTVGAGDAFAAAFIAGYLRG